MYYEHSFTGARLHRHAVYTPRTTIEKHPPCAAGIAKELQEMSTRTWVTAGVLFLMGAVVVSQRGFRDRWQAGFRGRGTRMRRHQPSIEPNG